MALRRRVAKWSLHRNRPNMAVRLAYSRILMLLATPVRAWRRCRKPSRIIHRICHSYASRALALGESLPVIAKLLGHAQIQTTARYTHLTRDTVRDAAVRVAQGIAEDIFPSRSPQCPQAAMRQNGSEIPLSGRIAPGIGRNLDVRGLHSIDVRASVRVSAARIAADIGDDIFPPRMRESGLQSSGTAADAAASPDFSRVWGASGLCT